MACLNAIEYLKKFGCSARRPNSILGTAPCQGHIPGVVDVPNARATLRKVTDGNLRLRRHATSAGPIKHIKGDIQMPLSEYK